jgi:hypothetical protein
MDINTASAVMAVSRIAANVMTSHKPTNTIAEMAQSFGFASDVPIGSKYEQMVRDHRS